MEPAAAHPNEVLELAGLLGYTGTSSTNEAGETDMAQRPNGSATLLVTIVMIAIVLAAANVAALIMTLRAATGTSNASVATAVLSAPYLPELIYSVAAPLVAGLLIALLALRRAERRAALVEAPAPAAPPPPSPAAALRLLGLLQQEARLVDFITEDIDGYSDEQVGAAVRSIHSACRKVLNEHVQLQRIFDAEDGSDMVVDQGFDPAAVRLTGNVTGQPPFRGTLQHGGWRAINISLPDAPLDPNIIAPAEVEIP
jgi:hypothetical protein